MRTTAVCLVVSGLAVLGALAAGPAISAPPVTLPPLQADARVEVVATCPSIGGQLNESEFNFMAATQDLLLPSLAAVQTYAKPELGVSNGTRPIDADLANPSGKFGIIGMTGLWDFRVVFIEAVGTPTMLQQHADALTKLVPRPDRVVVCPTAVSESRRNEISNALFTAQPRNPYFYAISSFTPTGGKVGIQLRSDGEAFARELQQKYGSDIVLTLGNFSWPDPKNPGPGDRLTKRCGVVPTSASDRKIRWTLPKQTLRATPGGAFEVSAQIRSAGKTFVEVTPFRVAVTKPGTKQIVANWAAQVAYTLERRITGPKIERLSITGGTDSCDSSTGWALPPGEYDVYITSVPGRSIQSGESFTSPPIKLVVAR
jgi:hypothetical protein